MNIQNEDIFGEDINLGFGIGKCLEYLNNHKELLHDGIEDDNDEEIDINRYDDFGNKIKPFEQYKMLCHQFHGKKPNKSKSKVKSSNRKLNKMKASEILKIRRNFK